MEGGGKHERERRKEKGEKDKRKKKEKEKMKKRRHRRWIKFDKGKIRERRIEWISGEKRKLWGRING